MSDRRNPQIVRHFRLNFRVFAVLAVLSLVLGLGVYLAKEGRQRQMSRDTIAAATSLYQGGHENGNADLAIRHLSQHLIAWPADADALELKARILYEIATRGATNVDQTYDAARVNEQLLRLAPDEPFSQDVRRHLVELDVSYSDVIRETQFSNQFMNELYARNIRYRTAEEVARQLVDRGGRTPGDYLLWAKALDGMGVPGDPEALAGAVKQYQNVLAMTPANVDAAERLSKIYQGRMNDPERAELVLNELIKAAPKSVKARLARHRLFVKLHRNDKAAEELEQASRFEPTDEELRDLMISSAEFLLRKGDSKGAAAQLDRVPEKYKDDVRVVMVRGLIDFEEEQPDEAIDAWRNGLQVAMGTDADLTWWLAYTLIQMNRVKDARPLLDQYARLTGGNDPKARFLQAMFFERTGRPSLALAILESIHQQLDSRYQGMIALARGRCAEALWDENKAKDAYAKALENDPGSVVARLALAKLKLKRRPDEALAEIERGLKIDPENPALRIALVGARLRREAAKPAGRRSWVEFDRDWRAAADKSKNSALVLLWADRLSLDNKEEEALKFLEESVAATAAESTKSAAVAVALANGYNRLGKPDLAIKALDRTKPLDQASLRIARAITYTAQFRGREAREALTKNVELLPNAEQFQVWMAAGQFDADRGDLDAAQVDYEFATDLGNGDPRPVLVRLELGLANSNRLVIRGMVKGLYDIAKKLSGQNEEDARQVAKADLSYMIARAKELLWLAKETDLAEALTADVEELDELDVDGAKLRQEKTKVIESLAESADKIRKQRLKETAEEIAKLEGKALGNRRDEVNAEIDKAVAADESKKLADSKALKIAKAAKLVDAIVYEAPQLPASLMLRAGVLELQGDLDNAIAVYMKVWERGNEIALPRIISLLGRRRRYDSLAQLRENPAASKSQVDLFSAQVFLGVGDRTNAARIADQLALDMNGSTEALGWKARMLDHLGRIDDVENVLRALAERRPSIPEPWLNLIRFLADKSRKQALDETIVRAKAAIKPERPETLDARIAEAAGNIQGAATAYAEAAVRYPDDVPTRLQAARFFENQRDFEKAEVYLNDAAKLAPADRSVKRQLAEVLSAHSLRDKPKLWTNAWEILGLVKDEKAAPPEDRLAWAIVLHNAPPGVGKLNILNSEPTTDDTPQSQALKLLENLKRDLPLSQSGNVRKTLAIWLTEKRVPGETKAGESGTSGFEAKKNAEEAERMKQAEDAIQPIAAAGTDPTAIALYAQVLIQSKKIEAAEWQLDRLAALSPGDAREASLRARLILNRARPVEAAQDLEQAYTNREDDPGSEALGREAFVLLVDGHPRDPSVLRLAERLARKNPACSWMPAQVQARRGGKGDEAFELLKTAAQSATRFDDLVQTGRVALTLVTSSPEQVTNQKAEGILNALLAKEPEADVLNIMMAMLKHVQGNYEEEVRLYKKALLRRPEDYTILNNLAWALCEGLNRATEALPHADLLVKKYGDKDPLVKDTQGVIYTRLKRYEEAIEDLTAVVKAKPTPLHLLHLARAQRLAGDLTEARKNEDSARIAGIAPQDIDPAERKEILDMLKP